MHLHIKICGLRRAADTDAVNRYRPDYAGFVFAKSPRRVDRETARVLKARLAADIPVLGVFVNSPADKVAALANAGIIDGIQLHGDEDEQYLQSLRQQTRVPLVKAVRLRADSAAELARCTPYADYILLDVFQPGVYGGTGRQIEAALLQDLRIDKPFFLAGGLTGDNVEESIRKVLALPHLRDRLYGVDVSGGVETDGQKDEGKIRKFIETVRGLKL